MAELPHRDLESRQAHPYEFAPLPAEKYRSGRQRSGHERLAGDLLSGTIRGTLVVRSRVIVASGQYALSEDAGFEPGFVVRGIVRSNGQPVIPGSSLRGALRSTFEIVTRSCFNHVRPAADERYHRMDRQQSRVPRALIDQLVDQGRPPVGRVRLEIETPPGLRPCRARMADDTARLCPACLVFGVQSWQGLLSVEEARPVVLTSRPPAKFALPALQGPQLHRAGRARVEQGPFGPMLKLSDLYGRKVYYSADGRPAKLNPTVPADYIPEGSSFAFSVQFRNLLIEELGALAAAMGLDTEHRFPFRLGGGKPFGLGIVEFGDVEIHRLDPRAWATDLDPGPATPISLNECLAAFLQSPMAHLVGLEALERIARPFGEAR